MYIMHVIKITFKLTLSFCIPFHPFCMYRTCLKYLCEYKPS